MLLMQDKPLLKALRRSQTSFWSANISSSTRTRPSWIHLRSVLLVVASSTSTTTSSSSTSSSSSPLPTDRGSLKSPWSRRRRKHALLPKQWKSYFDAEGRLLDGGVKFLKKARSGGVDPSIRAEVWPFLLGVYDLKTTKKERDIIKAQKRKEYVSLRRRCQELSNKSFKSKEETFENESNDEDSGDLSEVLNSPGLEEVASARNSVYSVYANEVSPECKEKTITRDGDSSEVLNSPGLDEEVASARNSVYSVYASGVTPECEEKTITRDGDSSEVLNSPSLDEEVVSARSSVNSVYANEVSPESEEKTKTRDGNSSQVLNSPGLDKEVFSARSSVNSVYTNEVSPECQEEIKTRDGDARETDNVTSLDEDSKSAITTENVCEPETDSSDSDSSAEPDEMQPLISQEGTESNDLGESTSKQNLPKSDDSPSSQKSEDFTTWQRIIRVDAVRANAEWVLYSPSQASISEDNAIELAKGVGLKDFDHLEPCRIYHAARLVAILEAYMLYDPEIGYCQGMSDLLSPIIAVMEDNIEAFWCFVGFMQKARHNFRLDEVGIRRQLNIVAKIIKIKDSHLYRHLEKLEAEDCFFVYRMVVVLFRRELDFEQVLCLWEVMWADQAAIRAGIAKSTWGRLRSRAPPTEDLLLYAIAASVLQKRKLIIEKYSSMDEILRECNSMAGHLDVWKLLDDAHDLVVTLHDKIQP